MRILRWIVSFCVFAGLALWLFGPVEPADLDVTFDPARLGDDLDAYFASVEADVPDLKPGTEKRVLWAGEPNTKTDIALIYVHGFSATSEEIRPVPARVAEALGANIVYTRLAGHGRAGDAMAEATVAAWMSDLSEALAAARKAGDRVVVLSTSTGGTLVTAAAQNPILMERVAGLAFFAPNYDLNSPFAPLIRWPAARYWMPYLVGERRAFEPRNALHAQYWTTEYPTVSVLPMGALIREVYKVDPADIQIPALFRFSMEDEVVRGDLTLAKAEAWGGPTVVSHPTLTAQDDPQKHVIAGDIMSPGQTEETVALLIDWIKGL